MEGGVGEPSLLESFCGVTSCTEDEAVFFLESHNWHLDSALSSYYEQQDHSPLSSSPPPRSTSPPPAIDASNSSLPPHRLPAVPTMSSSSRRPDDFDNKRKGSSTNKGSNPSSGRIRTLSDLGRGSGFASSDENDPDAPQEYYTGGEKSGMLVQGPSKGNDDVDSIFEQARQLGALEGPAVQVQQSSGSKSFTGTGRLLSGETVQAPQSAREPENVVHDVVFWSNGFTVNDGPLRRLDDPENASFLESIQKSECPEELEPADRRTSVHINLIRRNEDFPIQEKRYVPFQGVGRTLGSSSSSSVVPDSSVSLSANSAISFSSSSEGLTVDPSLPSTSIQLRLSDGTRLVTRFNHHHTVAHVRAFIDAARPGSSRSYQLQVMGFPPKLLTDLTQTIEHAGLANSVVVQKP